MDSERPTRPDEKMDSERPTRPDEEMDSNKRREANLKDKSPGPGGMMAGADFFKLSAGAKKEAVKAEKIYKHGRLKSIC